LGFSGFTLSTRRIVSSNGIGDVVKSAYALAVLEPYLSDSAPEPNRRSQKPSFEDMVSKAQQSVVLILCY
jgi:hypothetical protein